MSRTLLVCLTVLTIVATCAADVDLVRDGAPAACIVVPAGADAKVTLAAEELGLYVQKMSGAVLAIEQEPPPGVKTVVLGAPDDAWAAAVDLSTVVFGGFVVECAGDRVVLAGSVSEGTLNAVYWLLEELGVRWFIPTDLGENVPELATITIPAQNSRVEPTFLCRKNHGIDRSIRGHGNVWQRRIRITDHAINVPFNRYSHNLCNIVRIKEHAETHPEYFPLINGERRIPVLNHTWQPCTTNPEVIQLAVDAAKDWWEAHPDANYFSLGMNDGTGWCQCDKCTALDIPGYTFRRRPVKSERYFTFVKQVAEAVLETHPDKWITCIAYSSVEPVPRGIELPGNVMVVITQDVGAWHDPEYRAEDEAIARAWTEAAGAFGVYNYTSQMWLLPRSFPRMMAESLRFYDDIGAVAMTNESWPTWWYAGPMMYARAKLMWDPQQDVGAVLDDYYTGFFGPASEPMARLYERFEETMMTEREGRWFYGISSVPEQIALWTPEQLEASVADLAEAKRLAVAEPFDARVEFVAQGFALTDAILREFWQAQASRDMTARMDVTTEQLMDSLKTFAELTARREAILEQVMQDELLSGTYDRLINERGGRLTSWKTTLNSAYLRLVGAVYSRPDITAEQLAQIPGDIGADIALQVAGFRWAMEHPDAENLCPNPGFEETTGEAPVGVDWVATGSPPGWSRWSIENKAERITWEQAGGRSGPRCGKIVDANIATFIAQIPVQPGEAYYASIWVKSTGSVGQSPRLAIKWQAAEGGWVSAAANETVEAEGGAGEWQLITAIVEVPEGAGRLVILPRARDQQDGDVVLLDDARIVRLPDDLVEAE